MLKDAFFSALTVIAVVALAAVAGPKGPTAAPDPALGGANPRPEWPFLWLFALLSLSPASAETFIILVFPVLLIAALILVPFLSNRGERAPSRRPVAVLSVIVIATALSTLTYLGATAPWSPEMTAWSGVPVPEDLVVRCSPLQLQGAVMFQNKNCRNCHALEDRGGRRGPDLTRVGARLTRDQLIDQVSNGTPGGGNMPAYGKLLNAAVMTSLVVFIVSLRPPGQPPARSDAASIRNETPVSPTLDAFLCSWPFDPWLLLALALTAAIYLRGWRVLHRRDPWRWPTGRLAAFLGGLAAIDLALASPIEPFAALLLQVHMIQHLLLMMVAPPLLWLGTPLLPMIRGMPGPIRTYWVAPLLRARWLRRFFARVTHPVAALPLFVASTWLWHLPLIYEAALRSSGLHYLQHACFLGSALLFWYPVVRPYPGRPRWSLWLLFPYLILADVQNTVLSALLTFSDRVLYAHYAQVPRIWRLSAARRPVGGRRHHVGARLDRISVTSVRYRPPKLLFGEPAAKDRSPGKPHGSRDPGRSPWPVLRLILNEAPRITPVSISCGCRCWGDS